MPGEETSTAPVSTGTTSITNVELTRLLADISLLARGAQTQGGVGPARRALPLAKDVGAAAKNIPQLGNNSFGTWKRDLLASLKVDGLARYVLEQVPRTEADFEDGNNVVMLYISSSIDEANRAHVAHLATAREMYSTLEQLHGGANRLLTFQQAWQDLITLKPPVGAGKKTFLDDFRKLQNKLADAAASLDDDKAKYAVPDPLIAMQLLSSLPKPESNALVLSILAEHSNKLGSFSSASVYSRLQLELQVKERGGAQDKQGFQTLAREQQSVTVKIPVVAVKEGCQNCVRWGVCFVHLKEYLAGRVAPRPAVAAARTRSGERSSASRARRDTYRRLTAR